MEGYTTVWKGTAFNCTESNNEIDLRDERFILKTCNDGAIVAQVVGTVDGGYIISRLNVILSTDMLAKSIECAYMDTTTLTARSIGSYIIPTAPIEGIVTYHNLSSSYYVFYSGTPLNSHP